MTMFLITIPLLFVSWVVLCPDESLALIVRLKHQLRSHIIRRSGLKQVREVERELHDWAVKNDIDPSLEDEILERHQSELIHRLGEEQATAQLGEPTLFERYY